MMANTHSHVRCAQGMVRTQTEAPLQQASALTGWQRQTLATRSIGRPENPIGRDLKPGWGVTYIARIRIRLGSQASGVPSLVRQGSGAGHGIDVDLGLAHESALKEAETDAM